MSDIFAKVVVFLQNADLKNEDGHPHSPHHQSGPPSGCNQDSELPYNAHVLPGYTLLDCLADNFCNNAFLAILVHPVPVVKLAGDVQAMSFFHDVFTFRNNIAP